MTYCVPAGNASRNSTREVFGTPSIVRATAGAPATSVGPAASVPMLVAVTVKSRRPVPRSSVPLLATVLDTDTEAPAPT